jgi:outer membrane protein W
MKKLIIAAFLLAGLTPAFAQEPAPKLYTLPSPYDRYVHYQVTARLTGAVPLGSFKSDYIDKASFENYSIALEWVLQNSFSLGGEIGYSYFKQRLPRALYVSGEQTVSAVQTRTMSQYPIQVFANYHFLGKESSIQPYVQISGGASILDYTVYYGSLTDQKQKVRPTYGIGVGSKFLFKKDGSFGADVRVKYAGTSFKYDYLTSGVSSLNTSVGLFYRWW